MDIEVDRQIEIDIDTDLNIDIDLDVGTDIFLTGMLVLVWASIVTSSIWVRLGFPAQRVGL